MDNKLRKLSRLIRKISIIKIQFKSRMRKTLLKVKIKSYYRIIRVHKILGNKIK